ncbi:DUF1835 domain-containing protein [Pseudonocardia lacus]|uniref:DUF1835 domain-containing protein n=1 Tax=Pseudonocardia lacus TaxID=2835865 RepID=UPI001BDCAB3C|nr:DUF1835 domain-containing protein [Pseudonocardia lacus]
MTEPDPSDLDRLTAALHVSNGDATEVPGTGLAERVIYWRDALHEGPVPAVGADELRRTRAAFLSRHAGTDPAGTERELAERDHTLDAARDGEYVLWFEADLYDQLQIVQVLARLAELRVPADRITLICIGEHPAIARFGGLGELTAAQLRALAATNARRTLTPAALDLATRAWAAFRAPTPSGLAAIAATRSTDLRFLGEAFDRLGHEYPAHRDGLSLTERRALAAVAGGAPDAGTAFVRAAARETRPFLGDLWFFAIVDRLATAPHPLLDLSDRPVDQGTAVRLTRVGERVLGGEADHVVLNGVDRWVGGVRLLGNDPGWRWDDGVEAVVGPSAGS